MSLYFKYFSAFQTKFKVKPFLSNMRSLSLSENNYAKSKTDDSAELDKPIQYLQSDAARWKAEISRTGSSEQYPWYQSYVISISLSIFMLYFFILREESDIDLEFGKNLYDRIEGLEEKQLEIVVDYKKTHGISYIEEKERLSQLKENKEL